jgi:hypothetical protein
MGVVTNTSDRSTDYSTINDGKESFDDVYNRPDPRGYYRELGGLDYEIPARAKPVFEAVVAAEREMRGIDAPTILDLGCSYGINAALLKYDLDLDDLAARYRRPDVATAPVAEVICRDYEYFHRRRPARDVTVIGVDVADQAVGYAHAVGILDAAMPENLEDAPPSRVLSQALDGVDLVASTGCVGYVTERTFEHIIAAADGEAPPWIASFVLRVFPYDAIERTFAKHGLVTERLEGAAFAQRRFASGDERDHALAALRRLGRDASDLESDGHYYAEFFLSRPAEEARAMPLREIIADGLGADELAECATILGKPRPRGLGQAPAAG